LFFDNSSLTVEKRRTIFKKRRRKKDYKKGGGLDRESFYGRLEKGRKGKPSMAAGVASWGRCAPGFLQKKKRRGT